MARINERLNCPSQKRKLQLESNSINDEDLQLTGNSSSQLLCQLESKHRELEERMNNMLTKLHEEVKSQSHKLQQQYEQVLSRIDTCERRLSGLETMNQHVPRHNFNSRQYSPEMKSNDTNIDQLTKDFEERFELVESNGQTLTERLDSCQQSFAKMNVKTKTFENQLVNIEQRLNNFEIHDTNMQPNETVVVETATGTVIYYDKHTKNNASIISYFRKSAQ